VSNFQTNLNLLIEETHRSAPADIDRATYALIKSMESFSNEPYWFNRVTFEANTIRGVQVYPLPDEPNTNEVLPFDILQIRVSQIRVSEHWYDPMQIVDIAVIREFTYTDDSTLGYPDFFAVYGKNVFLYSIPKENFPWRIDYIKRINQPRYRFDGEWNFEIRDPENPTSYIPIPADFENEWLQHADGMIRAYAKWLLYKDYYNDVENAVIARGSYEEEEYRVRSDDTFQQSGGDAKFFATPI